MHDGHPYMGDLVAPGGTEYRLHDRAGGSADSIDQTFAVDLSGEAANGTWQLKGYDAAVGDSGHVDRWKLPL